jgi:hypothetical protein
MITVGQRVRGDKIGFRLAAATHREPFSIPNYLRTQVGSIDKPYTDSGTCSRAKYAHSSGFRSLQRQELESYHTCRLLILILNFRGSCTPRVSNAPHFEALTRQNFAAVCGSLPPSSLPSIVIEKSWLATSDRGPYLSKERGLRTLTKIFKES